MKIGIIGSGLVGSTAAYAMVMRGIGREIVLVDINRKRAQAEADDILHAVPLAHPMEVNAGDYSDLVGSKVILLAAGVNQRPGESRLELLARNAAVFQQIMPAVLEYASDAIFLVATNPVDIMTHLTILYAARFSVPSSRVIGSGTTLDTARFRSLLARKVGVDAQHVHAYVIGEHGDSEVLTWSLAAIGGIPLEEFCRLRELDVCAEDKEQIDDQVRNAAYHIIEGKGATYYGIGSALARITEVILRDQRSILTVCTRVPEVAGVKNITLSLPHLVGGDGVLAAFHPTLNEVETESLKSSASLIQKTIFELESGG